MFLPMFGDTTLTDVDAEPEGRLDARIAPPQPEDEPEPPPSQRLRSGRRWPWHKKWRTLIEE